jgi:hypothetical protein
VLYKLPLVMGASRVLIVEGEKDVETAYRLPAPLARRMGGHV